MKHLLMGVYQVCSKIKALGLKLALPEGGERGEGDEAIYG
jgi:hypothetical protein